MQATPDLVVTRTLTGLGLREEGYMPPPLWEPYSGRPQEVAYYCQSDVIGYGGAAGGGKTDLALGKAGTQYYKSIIFRREFPQLADVITRGNEIFPSDFKSGTASRWVFGGRSIELSSIPHEKNVSRFKGRPHDLIVFDEAVDFLEKMVRFVSGWLRTDRKDVKPQLLLCFNPPTTPEGEWIINFFAPWLDDTFSDPAEPGEIRWVVTVDERDVWVDGPEQVEIEGETYTPKSRTFFRALVEDNPVYMATGYDKQLESLPEPLRSQLRWGDFSVTSKDDLWQVIPTQWVIDAQNRWIEQSRPDVSLEAIGADPSRGGNDETAIAKKYGHWFELLTYEGQSVPDGATAAKLITDAMGAEDAPIWLDSLGIGSSVYDHLKVLDGVVVNPVNVGLASSQRDKSGRYRFNNLRSQIYWQLREALDPANGEGLAIPPDRRLRADLIAPRYKVVGGKIVVEGKEEIRKRIGRSPDAGEAIMLAWHGAKSEPIDGFSFDWPEGF